MTVATIATVLESGTTLDLAVCACLTLLTTATWTYRVATRRFGWGPRDT